jgi:hypothetical protein
MHSSLAKTLQVTVLTMALAAVFQMAAPAQTYMPGPPVSKYDIFVGYGYFHPSNSGIAEFQYKPIDAGAVTTAAGYLTPHLGLQAEGSFFPSGPDDCVYTAQAGPIARMTFGRWTPFVHALGGGAKVGGPAFQPCSWGWGVTGGTGIDYVLKQFHDHVAIRPIQADFEYSHVNYGPIVAPADVSGGTGTIVAYRLSAGIVVRFGDMRVPPNVALACALQPATVFIGDPVSVTATATNLNPRRPTTYRWSTNGPAAASSSETLSISTRGAVPGTYTVTGHVEQGPKAFQMADCTTNYTVRGYDPPTISCSANPSTVNSGEPSTITSVARSPQNRALSYSYTATGGQIVGDSATAILGTTGASPSVITITCNVVDDLGKKVSATTVVTIATPPPIPVPQAVPQCDLTFHADTKRPLRVDNASKACLDQIALALGRDPSAKLVIVGNHAPGEAPTAGAERSLNVRQYLVDEKFIDPSRIILRSGDAGTKSVDNSLLPVGASYTAGTAVDPDTIQRHGAAYGKPKPKRTGKARRRKKAAPAPAQ